MGNTLPVVVVTIVVGLALTMCLAGWVPVIRQARATLREAGGQPRTAGAPLATAAAAAGGQLAAAAAAAGAQLADVARGPFGRSGETADTVAA